MTSAFPEPPARVEELRSFVAELSTIEGRLAVSGGILVATALLAAVVAPYLSRTGAAVLREHVLNEWAVESLDTVSAYMPTTVGRLFLRLFQVGVAFFALVTLLTVWGLTDAAAAVLRVTGLSIPLFVTVAVTLGIVLGAYIAIDLFDELVAQFHEEAERVTKHQEEILLRLGHLGVITFAFTGILTLWGIDLSGLLVGAGFLGIVVGMAARETLGSVVAGFVLMFTRPFTIGDWVEIGDSEGIVTSITIMNTRIKNFDGEAVVIPNDIVSNRPITNRTHQGHLRTRLDVGIDYDADPKRAQELALATMEGLDAVAVAPPPQVVSKSFGDSAIVLELRFWIDRPTPQHRWRAIESVIHGVKDAFDREGIKIPYPQRELSGREETGGFRVRNGRPESEPPRPTPED